MVEVLCLPHPLISLYFNANNSRKYENPWLFYKVCESALVWFSKELRSSQLLITMTSSPVSGDTLKSWNFYIITKRFYPLVFGHGLGYKAKWQRWAFKVLSFLCNFHHMYTNSNLVVNNYILDFWLDYLTFFLNNRWMSSIWCGTEVIFANRYQICMETLM